MRSQKLHLPCSLIPEDVSHQQMGERGQRTVCGPAQMSGWGPQNTVKNDLWVRAVRQTRTELTRMAAAWLRRDTLRTITTNRLFKHLLYLNTKCPGECDPDSHLYRKLMEFPSTSNATSVPSSPEGVPFTLSWPRWSTVESQGGRGELRSREERSAHPA